MKAYLDSIINISSPDPDNARRGRLLNIMVLGVLTAAILGFVLTIFSILTGESDLSDPETQVLLLGIFITALGLFIIYQVNRRYSARLAALLFLLFLTLIFTFTDSAEQLANGRSLVIYTLPIAISSLILLPQASFLFATISSAIVAALANSIGLEINVFGIIGFFLLALFPGFQQAVWNRP